MPEDRFRFSTLFELSQLVRDPRASLHGMQDKIEKTVEAYVLNGEFFCLVMAKRNSRAGLTICDCRG
jgi:hypothetical protein